MSLPSPSSIPHLLYFLVSEYTDETWLYGIIFSFDVFKSVLSNSNNIASVIKLLNGKVDAKSLATIFATYLLKSKLASSSSAANSEAASFAQQVASAVNLSQCSGIADVISKLTASDKQGTDDLASKLTQAVNLIKTLNTKA